MPAHERSATARANDAENAHLDDAFANVVGRDDGGAERAVLKDLDRRRVDLGLGLEVEEVHVPRVPVIRPVRFT